MADVDVYYDTEYDILVDSEEEDQIYEVVAGNPLYRTEHQVRTLQRKLPLEGHVALLDYGCAKSSTIRMLATLSPGIVPHLYDVSSRYIPFWEKFTHPAHWAVNSPKPEWDSYFDVVTSFFSLEHIPTPARTMREIARLLKPGGHFYAIVPNVATNVADLVVVDHCNHFSATSLTRLVSDAGLELLEIDANAHRGAFVVVAMKPRALPAPAALDPAKVGHVRAELAGIAAFWDKAASRVRDYEASIGGDAAIYGAGFYGAFIATSLSNPSIISCHIDQNPYLQGQTFDGKPVIAPDDLPTDVSSILVGLNPAHARKIISEVAVLRERDLDYFFL
ncbi:class I SAM-dependent methyltransferase [Lysobacter sp. Root494]|uniref:class I SAM-dependent methyltransferase n=1 Tax=Lysobacter sp. Root494 TaxID=1736549 RepID=UPI0006FE8195|nr:class I SAM-dependent methyltransferase [Lysobacter sp. Root494]KQY49727.1 hypothetical protein ASD14_13440 [Lysobacter sp. Root494]